MKSIAITVGLILLFITVPIQAQTRKEADKAKIEKAVKDKVNQLYSALDTLNPEAYMKLWSRKKIMGEMTPTGLEEDFKTLLKKQQDNMANVATRKTEILNVKIQLLPSEMALAFGNATTTQRMKGTGTGFGVLQGNIQNIDSGFMTIWVKESGVWKLIHLVNAVQTRFGPPPPKQVPNFRLSEAEPAMTEAKKAEVENAAKEKVKQLYASFDSMNLEAYEKLWSRDKIIGILTTTGMVKDFNAILTRFRTDFSNQKSHQTEIVDIKIQALSPELAFAFGKTNVRIVRTNGNIMNYDIADMTIWIKDSGEWKMTYLTSSSAEKK
jgi:hypothetical protein